MECEARNEPDGLGVYQGKAVDGEVVVGQTDAARDVEALVFLRVKHFLLNAFFSSCVHARASISIYDGGGTCWVVWCVSRRHFSVATGKYA